MQLVVSTLTSRLNAFLMNCVEQALSMCAGSDLLLEPNTIGADIELLEASVFKFALVKCCIALSIL